jgi:hypothetical protein
MTKSKLEEDIEALERRFEESANRPVVRLAAENFKAMLEKAKADFKRLQKEQLTR